MGLGRACGATSTSFPCKAPFQVLAPLFLLCFPCVLQGCFAESSIFFETGAKATSKSPSKETPKAPQNEPELLPASFQNTFRKKGPFPGQFFQPGARKWSPKGSPESLKIDPGPLFSQPAKTTDFLIPFYLILSVFELLETLKILLKRCTVVQN